MFCEFWQEPARFLQYIPVQRGNREPAFGVPDPDDYRQGVGSGRYLVSRERSVFGLASVFPGRDFADRACSAAAELIISMTMAPGKAAGDAAGAMGLLWST